MKAAAIYCRRFEDRGEPDLNVQRRKLRAYAKVNGLQVVAEFSDTETSQSLDELSHPGLRKLLTEMAGLERKWDVLLVVDQSHLARDPMLALYVARECEKHRVELRYGNNSPNDKDVIAELLLAQLRVFDRFHRRLGAQSGRVALQTNIAQGFRAGGQAPLGYKLSRVMTAGLRKEAPAAKSKLVVDPRPAKKVATFLRHRAAGIRRSVWDV